MDTHFSNKSSDSSLIPTAISAYRSYRNNLQNKIEELTKTDSSLTQSASISQRLTCQAELESQLRFAEAAMKAHASQTAYIKKTTAYTEKLKEINAKLRILNKNTGTMKGYFDTLANKLPGYLKNCLKK